MSQDPMEKLDVEAEIARIKAEIENAIKRDEADLRSQFGLEPEPEEPQHETNAAEPGGTETGGKHAGGKHTGGGNVPAVRRRDKAGKSVKTGAAAKVKAGGKQEEKTDLYDWLQVIVTAIVACILIFTFAVRTCGVIGPSMESTLFEGERLVISKLFYAPKQGDIVILRKESFKEEPIVKRIIALEGQTVDIDFAAGTVYVDGVPLDEPYANEPTYRSLDFNGEITVPEGCVFVLGDNRNRSNDSRANDIGCVDTRCILGKALFRLAPVRRFGSLYKSLEGSTFAMQREAEANAPAETEAGT